MRVFVTGAGGFVGGALCRRLIQSQIGVSALVRRRPVAQAGVDAVAGDLADVASFSGALRGCDAVVHLAARAHVLREGASDPLAEFRKANRDATLALAQAASEAGVRHFVFVSSIGVLGSTSGASPFDDSSRPAPHSPYAQSKLEAEEALMELSARTGLKLTIVRPPLIYGAGAPGNMRRLLGLVHRGWPLPLGAASARKSFVGADNLSDFLLQCLNYAPESSRTFVIADREVVSTAELVGAVAVGMGRRARLFYVPEGPLRLAGRLAGMSSTIGQLFDPLEVDARRAYAELEWSPPVSTQHGVAAMARAFTANPW